MRGESSIHEKHQSPFISAFLESLGCRSRVLFAGLLILLVETYPDPDVPVHGNLVIEQILEHDWFMGTEIEPHTLETWARTVSGRRRWAALRRYAAQAPHPMDLRLPRNLAEAERQL
jgi:hypothetical protein